MSSILNDPAKAAIIKADILANPDLAAQPMSNAGAAEIARLYNLPSSPAWYVWRNLSIDTVVNLITFANMTPLDVVPSVTTLPASPTNAQNATFNNQMALLHQWNARSLACQGKQFNLQNLTIGRTVAPMKNATYRAAMQDCLTAIPSGAGGSTITANWVGVRDAAKFVASRIEKLFSTGTGELATPANLVYEEQVTPDDIQYARELP